MAGLFCRLLAAGWSSYAPPYLSRFLSAFLTLRIPIRDCRDAAADCADLAGSGAGAYCVREEKGPSDTERRRRRARRSGRANRQVAKYSRTKAQDLTSTPNLFSTFTDAFDIRPLVVWSCWMDPGISSTDTKGICPHQPTSIRTSRTDGLTSLEALSSIQTSTFA